MSPPRELLSRKNSPRHTPAAGASRCLQPVMQYAAREPAATACGAVMVICRPNLPADELSRVGDADGDAARYAPPPAAAAAAAAAAGAAAAAAACVRLRPLLALTPAIAALAGAILRHGHLQLSLDGTREDGAIRTRPSTSTDKCCRRRRPCFTRVRRALNDL